MSGAIRAAVVSLLAGTVVLGAYVFVLRQDVPPWWVVVAVFVAAFATSLARRTRGDVGVAR